MKPWLPLLIALGAVATPAVGREGAARRVVESVAADLEATHRPDLARELRTLAGPAPGPGTAPRPWLAGARPRSPAAPIPLRAVSEFLRDLGRVDDVRRLLAVLSTPLPLWAAQDRGWLGQVRGLRTLGNSGGLPHDWRLWLGERLRSQEPRPGEDGRAWVRALVARSWTAAPTMNPQYLRHFLRRVLAEGHRHGDFFTGDEAGPGEAEVLLLLARNLMRASGGRQAAIEAFQVLVARTRGAYGTTATRRVRQAGDLARRELAELWVDLGRPDRATRVRRDQLHRTRAGKDVGRHAVGDRLALAELLGATPEARRLREEAALL